MKYANIAARSVEWPRTTSSGTSWWAIGRPVAAARAWAISAGVSSSEAMSTRRPTNSSRRWRTSAAKAPMSAAGMRVSGSPDGMGQPKVSSRRPSRVQPPA